MQKKTWISALFLLVSFSLHGDLFLDQPVGGETITWKTPYEIKWHAPAQEGYQAVTIYLEKANDSSWIKIIDNTHIKSDGEHIWPAGRLTDGAYAPPGDYKISIESDDGDAFGQTFTIQAPVSNLKIADYIKQIRKIKIMYDPGACPICFRVSLKETKALLPAVNDTYSIHLYKDERIISKLGQHGGENMLDDYIPIKLNPRDANVLKRAGGDTYSIHLIDREGTTIAISEIFLELRKFRIDRRNIPEMKPSES
jgi:hypothetical protein